MIYDKPITVLAMPDTQGIPTKGGLVKKFDSWCAEKTVYASRFWESVANGSRVDKLVELPLHRDVPAASYARLGGHTYRGGADPDRGGRRRPAGHMAEPDANGGRI